MIWLLVTFLLWRISRTQIPLNIGKDCDPRQIRPSWLFPDLSNVPVIWALLLLQLEWTPWFSTWPAVLAYVQTAAENSLAFIIFVLCSSFFVLSFVKRSGFDFFFFFFFFFLIFFFRGALYKCFCNTNNVKSDWGQKLSNHYCFTLLLNTADHIECFSSSNSHSCGQGGTPSVGTKSEQLFIQSAFFGPQAPGATAKDVMWSRNKYSWNGSYYYVLAK